MNSILFIAFVVVVVVDLNVVVDVIVVIFGFIAIIEKETSNIDLDNSSF